MALQHFTSWQGEISESVDYRSATVTLRARRGGAVLCTNGESEEYVRTSGFIPRTGDSHPDNTVLLAQSVTTKKDRGPNIVDWEALYEWTTPELIQGGGQIPGVPTEWTVEEGTLVSNEPIDQDVFGTAIMTRTFESPDPPLNEEVYESQYTYSRSGRPYNHTLFDMYRGAVNSDVWLGRPAGSCKIIDIGASLRLNTETGWQADLRVVVVKGKAPPLTNASPAEQANGAAFYTWHKRWRAEGYYAKRSVQTSSGIEVLLVRATDQFGVETTKPVLHSRATGFEEFDPNNAEWYLTQTKPHLPFGTFFNSA